MDPHIGLISGFLINTAYGFRRHRMKARETGREKMNVEEEKFNIDNT